MPKTQPAAPAQFRSRSAGTAGFTSSGGPQFDEAPIHGKDALEMMGEMEAEPPHMERAMKQAPRSESITTDVGSGAGMEATNEDAGLPMDFMEEEDEFDAIGSLADEFPVDQDLYVIALELHVDGKPLQALEVIKQALDGTIELEPRKKIELLRLKAAVLLVLGHDELATDAQMHAEQIESMN